MTVEICTRESYPTTEKRGMGDERIKNKEQTKERKKGKERWRERL